MPAIAKKVPAFFEPSLIRAAGSVLSSQIERPITSPYSSLTFHREIPPTSPRLSIASRLSISRSQTPVPIARKENGKRVHFKDKKKRPSASRIPSPASSANSSDEDSAEDSESELSTSSDLSEDGKIPKPDGEPGRPGRGGYNLERAVDWPAKDYKRLKKYVHQLVDVYLDVSSAYSSQSSIDLEKIMSRTKIKFPQVEQYMHCWPVSDLIRMRLKYTSGRERRLKAFRVAEEIVQAVSSPKSSVAKKQGRKVEGKAKKSSLKK